MANKRGVYKVMRWKDGRCGDFVGDFEGDEVEGQEAWRSQGGVREVMR